MLHLHDSLLGCSTLNTPITCPHGDAPEGGRWGGGGALYVIRVQGAKDKSNCAHDVYQNFYQKIMSDHGMLWRPEMLSCKRMSRENSGLTKGNRPQRSSSIHTSASSINTSFVLNHLFTSSVNRFSPS